MSLRKWDEPAARARLPAGTRGGAAGGEAPAGLRRVLVSTPVLTRAPGRWFEWRMSRIDPIAPTAHPTGLTGPSADGNSMPQRRPLTPAAERALAEAAARRAAAAPVAGPTEIDGRDGPEPVRYGDWEVKGIATDF